MKKLLLTLIILFSVSCSNETPEQKEIEAHTKLKPIEYDDNVYQEAISTLRNFVIEAESKLRDLKEKHGNHPSTEVQKQIKIYEDLKSKLQTRLNQALETDRKTKELFKEINKNRNQQDAGE
tara:strand:- start:38 stop:403 length:366 start_codon:yes stop_codon:yes gene_type:complete